MIVNTEDINSILNKKFPTINLTHMGLFRTRESRHKRGKLYFQNANNICYKFD